MFGAATRLYKLIVPYADEYDIAIGPSDDFYFRLNNFVPNYKTESPDFRLKIVDLSKCINWTTTTENDIRFYLCPKLYSIKFNETLTKIEKRLFNCSNWELTSLNIPKSVETMYLGNLENTLVQFDPESNLKELIYADDGWGNYNQGIWEKRLESNVKILDLSHCQDYFSKNLENFEKWFAVNYENYKKGFEFTTYLDAYDWDRIIFPNSYVNERGETIQIDKDWKQSFLYNVDRILKERTNR